MGKVSNPYNLEIKDDYNSYAEIKKSYNYDGVYGPIPDENGFVNLDYYARDYIADYANVTSIPEENQKYLDSGILPISMNNSFSGLTMCTEIDLSKLNVSHCKKMNYLFYKSDSKDIEVPSMNIIGIEDWNTISLENIDNLLSGTKSTNELNLSKWNVTNVISLINCFDDTEDIPSLNLSNWNLAKFNTFNNLFGGYTNNDPEGNLQTFCHKINMSNWNTSHITDLSTMFYYCSTLEELNVSRWDVSNITNVTKMFAGDSEGLGAESQLKTIIGLETWDISNWKTLDNFLVRAFHLEKFDISTWNTKNITSFNSTFAAMCSGNWQVTLEDVDIKFPIFDMTNCISVDSMFNDSYSLILTKYKIHFKNVPRSLNLELIHYNGKPENIIIDNYID